MLETLSYRGRKQTFSELKQTFSELSQTYSGGKSDIFGAKSDIFGAKTDILGTISTDIFQICLFVDKLVDIFFLEFVFKIH